MDAANQLLQELYSMGVVVSVHGPKLRLEPGSKVPKDFADRIKNHKEELLSNLKATAERPAIYCPWCRSAMLLNSESGLWCGHCERLAWRDTPSGIERVDYADEQFEVVDPPAPCSKCGTLELWQSAAGDLFGLTNGSWRCLRCDPPAMARRFRERAARLKSESRHYTC